MGEETAVYYPEAAQAAPIEGGKDLDLPTIAADQRLGNELVYALLCNEPVKIAEIQAQLGRHRSGTNYMAPSGGIDLPCDIEVLGYMKCAPDECPREDRGAAQPGIAADGASPRR